MNSFKWTLRISSAVVPAALIAIFLFLAIYAWPAIRYNHLGFLTETTWNFGNMYVDPVTKNGFQVPRGANYGIWVFILGTIFSSFIALLLAVPFGIGISLFLTEYCPAKVRGAFNQVIDILAMVPSVVYGLWGLEVLAPLTLHYIAPVLQHVFFFIPFFSTPATSGYGLLTSSLVLTLMIMPVICSTLIEAIKRVPRELRESGMAIGSTKAELLTKIILPSVKTPLIAAAILALGRALGETMAVLMVSGGAMNVLPTTLYSPISTLASFIASQLDSAMQDSTGMATRSLAEVAIVLLVIAVIVNAIARLLTRPTK